MITPKSYLFLVKFEHVYKHGPLCAGSWTDTFDTSVLTGDAPSRDIGGNFICTMEQEQVLCLKIEDIYSGNLQYSTSSEKASCHNENFGHYDYQDFFCLVIHLFVFIVGILLCLLTSVYSDITQHSVSETVLY